MSDWEKIDPAPFIDYIKGFLPDLLGTTREHLLTGLKAPEVQDVLKEFIGDEQDGSLFVSRQLVHHPEDEDKGKPVKEDEKGKAETDAKEAEKKDEDKSKADEPPETKIIVELSDAQMEVNRSIAAVCIVKRERTSFRVCYCGKDEEGDDKGGKERPKGPWQSQLHVVTLATSETTYSPFELAHNYLTYGFTPIFAAYRDPTANAADNDEEAANKVGTNVVQRKIAELCMALKQCQQNVEIEDIVLVVDPEIQRASEKAKADGTTLSVEMFQDKLEDPSFLNRLQSGMNKWSKEIVRLTKLTRDPSTGGSIQETTFWLGMETALNDVKTQIDTPEVQLTLNILKAARRFLASVSFESDCGLTQAREKVANYLNLLREFPINDLVVASSVEQMTQAIRVIFAHMRKIKNASQYPLWRAYNLVEAVSRDIAAQLLRIFQNQRIMQLETEQFEQIMNNCSDLFRLWDDEARQFRDLVREQLKKRGNNERPPLKLTIEHAALQERIADLQKFRRQHFKLSEVIERVLDDGKDAGAKASVKAAWEIVEHMDVLDVSRRGVQEWDSAKKRYEARIDHAESEITSHLRDRLGAAKNATEMFRVFNRFNALFVRPRIRGAIQEYQSILLQQVKDDVTYLQNKFKEKYSGSQLARMTALRDIPPTAGYVMWSKQLERRLHTYTSRVEDVLGRGWDQHVDGQKLKQDTDALSKKMNPNSYFEHWLKDIKEAKGFDATMRIFDVQQSYGQPTLLVNFDENIITLFKEVRNLSALGCRSPIGVKVTSDEARQNYPLAMTLREATRSYMQTCSQLTPEMGKLMASYQKSIQQLISDGVPLKWDSDRVEAYTKKLSEQVFLFQQKFAELEFAFEEMNSLIEGVDSIDIRGDPNAEKLLQEAFEKMQKIVDDMSLTGFANLDTWVQEMETRIEQRLARALSKLIPEWVKQFETWPANGVSLIHEGVVHELSIQQQQLILNPQKEFASLKWTRHFHDTLGKVCNLPRLQAHKYESLAPVIPEHESKHLNLMTHVDKGLINDAYASINRMIGKMEDFVKGWMQYQTLWEVSVQDLLERVGNSLAPWLQLLAEIKQTKSRLESSEYEKSFGPIIVDFRHAQVEVRRKYELWHMEILSEFGNKVQEFTSTFFKTISQARTNLEGVDPTGDLAAMCMQVLKIRSKVQEWEEQYGNVLDSYKVLERQKYKFPSDWQPIDQIEGEWDAFNQILNRRNAVLDRELPKLKHILMQRDRQMDETVTSLLAEWAAERPVKGSIKPNSAMEILTQFEKRLKSVQEELEQLNSVKEILSMEAGNEEALNPILDEIGNLKSVWSEINSVYGKLEELKETPWTAVVPKKIRAFLDEVIAQLDNMQVKLKQYEAWAHTMDYLKSSRSYCAFIGDLKTEALKERHWKAILGILSLDCTFNQLTLGHLLDNRSDSNKTAMMDVLVRAQGEMALEEFLKDLRQTWTDFLLTLVPYKSKTRLIKGWDDIFALVDEHLSSIQSMKLSQYYKSFEEEALYWDEKLNKIASISDTWMDVQRRWVYLEGIFMASADIQTLLPNEYSRFKGIDSEFLGLMKKAAAKPKILDAIAIPDAGKLLQKMADNLTLVQKALGDYLEKQRSNFARFYFVGDEDLLEMIGSSREVDIVGRHLAKMFAGLSALTTQEGNTDVLIAMNSKEGEQVSFVKEVKISDDPSINGWLSKTELNMQQSLGDHLNNCMTELECVFKEDGGIGEENFIPWVDKFPCQVVLMAVLVDWCDKVEKALAKDGSKGLESIVPRCISLLQFAASQVITDIKKDVRQKIAQMITEVVHHRDVSRTMLKDKVEAKSSFEWLQLMRMYFNPKEANILKKLTITMADATFFYGFEYLGIADKLVQTPLTDRCFLTLTQALHMRLGANPFGPAGTGKTESVKALGNTMGRFVLVFCCDEAFDFNAMGRIFIGLCEMGAWGCFDEFNRLEERILSAVSEQVLAIQTGNKLGKEKIEILGKPVRLNPNVGIFVTMNPGYAGRSNLPDNLKQLFRAMAMTVPDKTLIAQVNLFNQGFSSAERLAGKIVFLFDLCGDQLSSQPHYDFGLRSLKAVLACAGQLKRDEVNAIGLEKVKQMSDEMVAEQEERIVLRSVYDTLVPKLVAQDKPLMSCLIQGTFPGCKIGMMEQKVLQDEIRRLCKLRHLECSDTFMLKCMELYAIQNITHGIMLVGAVGTGKSAVWKVLLDAMEKVDGIKGDAYVVDPKAVSKDELYGRLDATTLEWTDGVFTEILRRVSAGLRGEKDRRQWIMFDGDVDPEWAENLNSVLDDNKMLTLPNGERLAIPPNVRIMFEVDTLKYATLATVSRCGMVWFAEDVVLPEMMCTNELKSIKYGDLEKGKKGGGAEKLDEPPATMEEQVKHKCVEALEPLFEPGGLVLKALDLSGKMDHIMTYTEIRLLATLFTLIRKGINMIIEYNEGHEEFPLAEDIMIKFIQKHLVGSMCWAFGGDMFLNLRMEFCQALEGFCSGIDLPSELGGDTTLLDFEARVDDGEWHHWNERVPVLDIEPEKVGDGSLIISTVDTIRHVAALAGMLEERKPFILSGPPGSGKTMTLMSTIKAMAGQLELASLNFSAGTTPELILQTFELYCEYVKTPSGVVLRPQQSGKWVVVFCDECNLPEADKYNTQKVIMFIRQITIYKGFYRPTDNQWVQVERVQFLGACNPPTDPGRHPMSDRFLRYAPVIWVDYPGPDSLKQIYGTFNRGMMKLQPHIPKEKADAMTNVMVAFWRDNSKKFTSDMQPHYLYSPRELTRWKVALYEAIQKLEGMTEETLIRLVMHEALRIFVDRIVFPDEKEWAESQLDSSVMEEFGCSADVLQRPIYFSTYLSPEGHYVNVGREELREFVHAKLKIFYEEVLAVKLVIFDEVLDHIVRMDRVLRQPLGHLLLVGASGAGKTVLSKFVSWMNGLDCFALKIGKGYDVTAFEIDLRAVMKRAGVKKEKITFIFDESNALGPAFLERMNALLASGEVPGLFEGDEYANLMSECRSAGGMSGMEDSEMFAKFTKQVQRNLHIVFTMNPANPDFYNRSNSSPALFNRCIIDWFGDWPHSALVQVASEFTADLDITAESLTSSMDDKQARLSVLANTIVAMHERVDETNIMLRKAAMRYNFITPRDFLDFIHHFLDILGEKREEVLEQQQHIDGGLKKLRETEDQVTELQGGLAVYEQELVEKNKNAEEKMSQMVKGQAEAEEKKVAAQKMSGELEAQSSVIEEKAQKIAKQIEEVEPALREAAEAVKSVDKKSLDEIRNLGKPPDGVKLAMEAAIIMVRPEVGTNVNWDMCKKIMKDSNFIPSILEFDTESLKDKVKDYVEKHYVSAKGWDLALINRASKCAGPVALWVQSQVKFAGLLKQMEPMRKELKSMQDEADKNKRQLEAQQENIKSMEASIQAYKEEYAQLISAVEKIKAEKESVQEKCERSTNLLAGLGGEKVRWEGTSRGFQEQMNSLFGDVLLAGAFCTFTGFFDLFMRRNVNSDWRDILEESGIKFKEDIDMLDYLSKGSQRLHWKENALPDDNLCYENAIIMKRFIRYPMIIDPAGQAITFLKNLYKDKRLMTTSFTEPQFMKHLESSLRFGAPLLVMDVDKVDPILNNVLNKETFKQGPRVLISLGNQDIDFSPSFELFMCTRDSTLQFTPDLCSRVTFVNFTVTPSSLQSQCMNTLLKSERPDIDQKRAELIKLQGEFKVKIRQLEDDLLQALSSVKGSILEDVKVIATMEKIKKESSEIEEQERETEKTMAQIVEISGTYDSPGQTAASIYFLLESMAPLNTFYKYSLAFFFSIFAISIKTECQEMKDCQGDYDKRLVVIMKTLFKDCFLKIAPGLNESDVLCYGLRLAQVAAEATEPLRPAVLDLLLKGATVDISKTDKAGLAEQCKEVLKGKLSEPQLKALQDVHILPQMGKLVGAIKSNEAAWASFLTASEAENQIPPGWECAEDATNEPQLYLQQLLIMKALRPDRAIFVCVKLLESLLGQGFLDLPAFNLAHILETDSVATAPLMFVSTPGFDASTKVTDLAQSTNKPLTTVAMGSEAGFSMADKAIAVALKGGQWVLLMNVHLAVKWLVELEKKLYSSNPAPSFRLFLTMEFSPKIPPNLIRLSRVYVFEPPSGIKASLQRSFAQIFPEVKTNKPPVERCRIHFLLAFLHAVVLERIRFYPVGWSKKYEFSDADQTCARDVIDNWLDRETNAGAMTNISPDKIPWDAIRTVLEEAVYGGRIDNAFDHMGLKSFIGHLFCEASFNAGFSLNISATKESSLLFPDARTRDQFVEWIQALPAKGNPQWIGLPEDAEQMLRINRANHTLMMWTKLQGSAAKAPKSAGKGQKRQSIKNPLADILARVEIFLQNLPESLPKFQRTEQSLKDPLWRCYDREMGFGISLLAKVRYDLKQLRLVCVGELKPSNDLKALINDAQSDQVPAQWRKFKMADVTMTDWISDFIKRCEQLQEIYDQSNNFQGIQVWFGGLFFPEAFLTASRQAVAENLGVSLEELLLVMDIGNTDRDKQSFLVKGLYMEGATWDQQNGCLATTAELSVSMPLTRLRWTHRDTDEYKRTTEYLKLAIYLNRERNSIVCPCSLRTPKEIPVAMWIQRSVCLTIWTKV